MTERRAVTVTDDLDGVRADKVLAVLASISRSVSRDLIESGLVIVSGEPIDRSTTLRTGDVIEYPRPKPAEPLRPEEIAFDVVTETTEFLVVDKPAGLVVHPGAGHESGTLVNGLIHRYPGLAELGEEYRWGLVHRLDRDTSGVLLVARTPQMHRFLQEQLKERRVARVYLAMATGRLGAATGTIDAPIGRDPARPTRMAVVQDGRPARTHYRRIAEWEETALVEISLETGRTHQIRVHFASIGHGLVGDPVYGRQATLGVDRIWLHAARLEFSLPTGDRVDVSIPLADDLARSLAAMPTPLVGTVDL